MRAHALLQTTPDPEGGDPRLNIRARSLSGFLAATNGEHDALHHFQLIVKSGKREGTAPVTVGNFNVYPQIRQQCEHRCEAEERRPVGCGLTRIVKERRVGTPPHKPSHGLRPVRGNRVHQRCAAACVLHIDAGIRETQQVIHGTKSVVRCCCVHWEHAPKPSLQQDCFHASECRNIVCVRCEMRWRGNWRCFRVGCGREEVFRCHGTQ
mmetsp:Transcript_51339/g.137020  ORF Transcript_51339/g.137020 Transcript_51339/m.137020 type:complete len:209 (-) Transcript_51339:20-646(-)